MFMRKKEPFGEPDSHNPYISAGTLAISCPSKCEGVATSNVSGFAAGLEFARD